MYPPDCILAPRSVGRLWPSYDDVDDDDVDVDDEKRLREKGGRGCRGRSPVRFVSP